MSQLSAALLAKVPLLLIATRLTALAILQAPPVSAEETKAYEGVKDPAAIIHARSRLVLGAVATNDLPAKNVCYAAAICESLVILAGHFPSVASDIVLTLLIRTPLRDSHDIRLTPWRLVGCIALIAGALIRFACFRALSDLFNVELSIRKDHKLVTTGPYSVVRHPSHTGAALLGPGILLCHFGPGSRFAECVGWATWGSWVLTAVWSLWWAAVPVVGITRMPIEDMVKFVPFMY